MHRTGIFIFELCEIVLIIGQTIPYNHNTKEKGGVLMLISFLRELFCKNQIRPEDRAMDAEFEPVREECSGHRLDRKML